jgi:hypothetical protein
MDDIMVKSLKDAEDILEKEWFPFYRSGYALVANKLWAAKQYLEEQRKNYYATEYAEVFADPDEQAKEATLAGLVDGLESHAEVE